MKAYLIDPFREVVEEIEYDDKIETIYKLIECTTFDVAHFHANGDGVFVDDEGLFKEGQRFFKVKGYPQPLAGKGLVLGLNADTGESISPRLSLKEVVSKISFYKGKPYNHYVV